jgi:DNA polymerase-2
MKKPVDNYILSTTQKVMDGKFDSKLIYRKRLRKKIHEYTTNVPPHVQAARLLDKPENVVRYVITVDGPQPIEKVTSKLDYDHYINSQLKPIADSILEWINLDFDTIITGQQNLF